MSTQLEGTMVFMNAIGSMGMSNVWLTVTPAYAPQLGPAEIGDRAAVCVSRHSDFDTGTLHLCSVACSSESFQARVPGNIGTGA